MIQILTCTGNEKALQGKDVVLNTIHDAQSLDEFDVNVINLKDMIPDMKDNILKVICYNFKDMQFVYENTRTKIVGNDVLAAFYFDNGAGYNNVLTKSVLSEKPTTVSTGKKIFSFLQLTTYDSIMDFLKVIGLISEAQSIPVWMEEIRMFDDNRQYDVIRENNDIIKISQANIDAASQVITKNEEYKSILYTTGDELVNVVMEILEEIFGCSLNDFVDKKREDFAFLQNGVTYIGEVKGISSNVKSQNISQLEFHHQGFLDEHEETDDSSIRQLLIINHQRAIAVDKRDPVDSKQIELARKYGSLIIETSTLLRMFEKCRNGELTKEDCFSLFDKTGLLSIE